jgi:hypothetical protein
MDRSGNFRDRGLIPSHLVDALMPPRLIFTRTGDDPATDMGYMRADGQYAAVRIADSRTPRRFAKQLQVLVEMMTRPNWGHEHAGALKISGGNSRAAWRRR